jgi:hypothetical protein
MGLPPSIAYINTGRLRALAVTSTKRSPLLPAVPTVSESGLPGFDVTSWYGVFGTAALPKNLVAKINGDIAAMLDTPDMKQRLDKLGADPVPMPAEEFAKFVARKSISGRKWSGRPVRVLIEATPCHFPFAPLQRRVSMLPRHSRYDYSPITERKDYSWPGGRRLAFCLTTNIAVHAFGKGRGHDNAKHGEPQTQRNYSWRDYGNRIGIWRLFDLADELDIPLAHNTNSLLYDEAPQIFTRIRARA